MKRYKKKKKDPVDFVNGEFSEHEILSVEVTRSSHAIENEITYYQSESTQGGSISQILDTSTDPEQHTNKVEDSPKQLLFSKRRFDETTTIDPACSLKADIIHYGGSQSPSTPGYVATTPGQGGQMHRRLDNDDLATPLAMLLADSNKKGERISGQTVQPPACTDTGVDYSLMRSLGIDPNQTGISWTSSLATPPIPANTVQKCHLSNLCPASNMKEDLCKMQGTAARALFSPGVIHDVDYAEDIDIQALNDSIEDDPCTEASNRHPSHTPQSQLSTASLSPIIRSQISTEKCDESVSKTDKCLSSHSPELRRVSQGRLRLSQKQKRSHRYSSSQEKSQISGVHIFETPKSAKTITSVKQAKYTQSQDELFATPQNTCGRKGKLDSEGSENLEDFLSFFIEPPTVLRSVPKSTKVENHADDLDLFPMSPVFSSQNVKICTPRGRTSISLKLTNSDEGNFQKSLNLDEEKAELCENSLVRTAGNSEDVRSESPVIQERSIHSQILNHYDRISNVVTSNDTHDPFSQISPKSTSAMCSAAEQSGCELSCTSSGTNSGPYPNQTAMPLSTPICDQDIDQDQLTKNDLVVHFDVNMVEKDCTPTQVPSRLAGQAYGRLSGVSSKDQKTNSCYAHDCKLVYEGLHGENAQQALFDQDTPELGRKVKTRQNHSISKSSKSFQSSPSNPGMPKLKLSSPVMLQVDLRSSSPVFEPVLKPEQHKTYTRSPSPRMPTLEKMSSSPKRDSRSCSPLIPPSLNREPDGARSSSPMINTIPSGAATPKQDSGSNSPNIRTNSVPDTSDINSRISPSFVEFAKKPPVKCVNRVSPIFKQFLKSATPKACDQTTKLVEPSKTFATFKPKAKRFAYPTSSQITETCPKKVFNLKDECDAGVTISKMDAPVTDKIGATVTDKHVSATGNMVEADLQNNVESANKTLPWKRSAGFTTLTVYSDKVPSTKVSHPAASSMSTVKKPSYPAVSSMPPTKPSYPAVSFMPTTKPSYPAVSFMPTTKPSYPAVSSMPTTKPSYSAVSFMPTTKPSYPAVSSMPTTKPSYPAVSSMPTTKPSYPAVSSMPSTKPSYPAVSSMPSTKPSCPAVSSMPSTKQKNSVVGSMPLTRPSSPAVTSMQTMIPSHQVLTSMSSTRTPKRLIDMDNTVEQASKRQRITDTNHSEELDNSLGFASASGKRAFISNPAEKNAEKCPSASETVMFESDEREAEHLLSEYGTALLSDTQFTQAAAHPITEDYDSDDAKMDYADTDLEDSYIEKILSNSCTEDAEIATMDAQNSDVSTKYVFGGENLADLPGFQCASGKKIRISAAAEERARLLIEEASTEHRAGAIQAVQLKPFQAKEINPEKLSSVGFHSASGKSLDVMQDNLSRYQKWLDEKLDPPNEEQMKTCLAPPADNKGMSGTLECTKPSLPGFKCASGKSLKINNAALEKIEKWLNEDELGNKLCSLPITHSTVSTVEHSIFGESNVKQDESEQQEDRQDVCSITKHNLNPSEIETNGILIVPKPSSGNIHGAKIQENTKDRDWSKVPKGFRPFKAPRISKALKEPGGLDMKEKPTDKPAALTIGSVDTSEMKVEPVLLKISSEDTTANENIIGERVISVDFDQNKLSEKYLTLTQIDEVTKGLSDFMEHDASFSQFEFTQLRKSNNIKSDCKTDTVFREDGQFGGFQTAAGKKMVVSDAALNNACKLLDSVMEEHATKIAADDSNSDCSSSTLPKIGFMKDVSMKSTGINIADDETPQRSFGRGLLSRAKDTTEDETAENSTKVHNTDNSLRLTQMPASSSIQNLESRNIDTLSCDSTKIIDVAKSLVTTTPPISPSPLKCRQVPNGFTPTLNLSLMSPGPKLDCSKSSKELFPVVKYGGFMSASGVPISVSADALNKATSLLASVDNDNMNFSELIAKEEKQSMMQVEEKFAGFSTGHGKQVTVNPDSLKKDKAIWDTVEEKFAGFSTACGKPVTVNPDNLKKAKAILDSVEIENDVKTDPSTYHCELERTCTGSIVKTVLHPTDNKGDESLNLENNGVKTDADTTEEMNESISPVFAGFKSASGKRVGFSDQSLQAARRLWSDSENHTTKENCEYVKKCSKGEITAAASDTTNTSECTTSQMFSSVAFAGFHKAKSAQVSISSDALNAARNTLKDCSKTTDLVLVRDSIQMNRRETACVNEASKISDDIIESSTKKELCQPPNADQCTRLLEDNSQTSGGFEMTDKPQQFVGFKTAKGRTVSISAASMLVAKTLLDDGLNGSQPPADDSCVRFLHGTRTASEGDSSQGMEVDQGNLDNEDFAQNRKLKPVNGSRIHRLGGSVSSSCSGDLPTKRESYHDITDRTHFGNEDELSTHLSADNQCETEEKCLNDVQYELTACKTPFREFLGFKTAKGTSVAISSKALNAAKTLLKEEIINNKDIKYENKNAVLVSKYSTLQTAQHTAVSSSPNTVNAAQLLLADDKKNGDVIADIRQESNVLSELSRIQKENRSNIIESQITLDAAKKVLTNEDAHDFDAMKGAKLVSEFAGFQTAKGNTVTVSSKAYTAAKTLLAEDSLTTKEEYKGGILPKFSGFQSANGGKINVSLDKLNAARELLNSTDEQNDLHTSKNLQKVECSGTSDVKVPKTNFGGFMTAKGGMVKVSTKSLNAAKHIFNEFDDSSSKAMIDGLQTSPDNNMDTLAFGGAKIFPTHCASSTMKDKINADTEELENEQIHALPQVPPDKHHQLSPAVTNKFITSPRKPMISSEKMPTSRPLRLCRDLSITQETHESTKALLADGEFDEEMWQPPKPWMKPLAMGPEELFRDRRPGEQTRCTESVITAPASDVSQITDHYDKANNPMYRWTGPSKYRKFNVHHKTKDDRPGFTPPMKLTRTHKKTTGAPEPATKADTANSFSTPYKEHLTSERHGNHAGVADAEQFKTPFKTPVKCDTSKLCGITPVSANPQPDSKLLVTSQCDDPELTPPEDSVLDNNLQDNSKESICQFTEEVKKSRLKAKVAQGQVIQQKKKSTNIRPIAGQLLTKKTSGKQMTLKDAFEGIRPRSYTKQQLYAFGVKPRTLRVTASSAEDFMFVVSDYYGMDAMRTWDGAQAGDGGYLVFSDTGSVTKVEICNCLLAMPGVEPKLISRDWVYNHYKWIIWKLAAMEVALPHSFAGRLLSPEQVLLQLKYRYDREVDNSHRSALKKIYEHDDSPQKMMVLCVYAISSSGSPAAQISNTSPAAKLPNMASPAAKYDQIPGQGAGAMLVLTDGWYSIRAVLDRPLTQLVRDTRISVGDKLCIYGAEFTSQHEPSPPLQASGDVMLRLNANSTRRARWSSKLGYCRNPQPPPLPLSSLHPDGGLVGCVDIMVTRLYPLQYLEKTPGGSVWRSSRGEERTADRFTRGRQQQLEKLYQSVEDQVRKETQDNESGGKRSHKRWKAKELAMLQDGADLYDAITQSTDPGSLEIMLSLSQQEALSSYRQQRHDQLQAQITSEIQRKVAEAQTQPMSRTVIPALKVRVAGCSTADVDAATCGMLTVWRPPEDIQNLLMEGNRLKIYSLTTSSHRGGSGSSISLSTGRGTRYKSLPVDDNFRDLVYEPREVLLSRELHDDPRPPYGEFDTVGLVVRVSDIRLFDRQGGSEGSVQSLYLADGDFNMLAVKLWGGLSAHYIEDIVHDGVWLACSNLQLKSDQGTSWPTAVATDMTHFSTKPREHHLQRALAQLQASIKDVKMYVANMKMKMSDMFVPKQQHISSRGGRSHSMSVQPTSGTGVNVRFFSPQPGGSAHTTAKPADLHRTTVYRMACNTTPNVSKQLQFNKSDITEHRITTVNRSNEGNKVDTEVSSGFIGFVNSAEGTEPEDPVLLKKKMIQEQKAIKLELHGMSGDVTPLNSPIPCNVRRAFKPPTRGAGTPVTTRRTLGSGSCAKSRTPLALKSYLNSEKTVKNEKSNDNLVSGSNVSQCKSPVSNKVNSQHLLVNSPLTNCSEDIVSVRCISGAGPGDVQDFAKHSPDCDISECEAPAVQTSHSVDKAADVSVCVDENMSSQASSIYSYNTSQHGTRKRKLTQSSQTSNSNSQKRRRSLRLSKS